MDIRGSSPGRGPLPGAEGASNDSGVVDDGNFLAIWVASSTET